MRFSDFITDRREVLLACFAGGIVFTLLLVLFGLGTGELVLLWICFLLIIISAMLAIWRGESRRAHLLLSEMEKLDQGKAVLQNTTGLGLGASKNGHILERKVR